VRLPLRERDPQLRDLQLYVARFVVRASSVLRGRMVLGTETEEEDPSWFAS